MGRIAAAAATVFSLGGLAALGALGGCSRTAAQGNSVEGDARVVVTLQPSVVRAMQRSVDVVGTLHGEAESTLSAKVNGRIVAIEHDLGDPVDAGGELARIDPVDFELLLAERAAAVAETLGKIGLDDFPAGELDIEAVPSVERARYNAKNEQSKYDRAKRLFEEESAAVSVQDLGDFETLWQVAVATHRFEAMTARALLAEARTRENERKSAAHRLAETVIRAPAPGDSTAAGPTRWSVSRRWVDEGEYVREGTPLFDVVDPDPIVFRADVPERHIADVAIGQRASARVDAFDRDFEGTVARVAPMIDAASRTFRVEIRVPNPEGLLRPGSFARGSIETRRDADVTLAPLEALAIFVGEKKVFSVADGKAVEHRVRTGAREEGFIEIVEGLSGEVPLVVTGTSKIAAGTPVEVKDAAQLDGPPHSRDPRRGNP